MLDIIVTQTNSTSKPSYGLGPWCVLMKKDILGYGYVAQPERYAAAAMDEEGWSLVAKELTVEQSETLRDKMKAGSLTITDVAELVDAGELQSFLDEQAQPGIIEEINREIEAAYAAYPDIEVDDIEDGESDEAHLQRIATTALVPMPRTPKQQLRIPALLNFVLGVFS